MLMAVVILREKHFCPGPCQYWWHNQQDQSFCLSWGLRKTFVEDMV